MHLFSQMSSNPRTTTAEFKSTAVLTYVKGLSKLLSRNLQQHCTPAVIKSNKTLRSHLVRPTDADNPSSLAPLENL